MHGGPKRVARSLATLLVASWGATAIPLGAQEPAWLPAPAEQGAAQQLADRLRAFGDASSDDAALRDGALDMIRAMRDGIDAWGAAGAVTRAPVFQELQVPGAASPPLDAMGRWSICLLDLMLRYEGALQSGDGGAGLEPALGLSAVTLVVLRLREPFVAAGGRQPEIESHLTSAGFEALLAAIQTDPRLRAEARAGCDPLLRELLAAPIAYLREQGARADG